MLPSQKKEMISKAVGIVLDMFAEPAPANNHVPTNVSAFNWGVYAAEAMSRAANDSQNVDVSPLASFARDLIAYASSHPEDTIADKYANLAVEKGKTALENLTQMEPALARKVLDVRGKRTQTAGTTTG